MASTALATYREDQEVLEAQGAAFSIADVAREMEITDEGSNNLALDLLSQARKAHKRFDKLKKRWTDPLTDQIKLIRSDMDAMAAPAIEADQILSRKTSDWRFKLQEATRKAQERDRLLAERRQERAAAKAEERGLEPPMVIPLAPTYTPPAKTVETDSGAKITYRKTPHMEIIDPNAVPRQFCVPNEKAIRAALVNGIVSEIPGVKFWYTEEAAVR